MAQYKLKIKHKPLKSTVTVYKKFLWFWIPYQSAHVKAFDIEIRNEYFKCLVKDFKETYKIKEL